MGVLPQQQRTAGVTMNAPVGGINTVTAAGAMPPTDCLALNNMIPYQYGLRVRAGFADWFTGIKVPPQATPDSPRSAPCSPSPGRRATGLGTGCSP